MATSGSSTWQLTRNQLIEAAMRKFGALAKGQTPDAEDYTNGQFALNAVMAELQTTGMQLWKRNEYQVSLVQGQAEYLIGVGQAINTPFPLKINQATLTDLNNGANIDMEVKSIYQYHELSPNTSSGTPTQVFYQPLINYGKLTVWPTPDSSAASGKQVLLTYQTPIEDFTASTETFDFPKEWHQTIIYHLAAALAPEYGIPLNDQTLLMKQADKSLERVLGFGVEEASFFVQPDRDRE